MQNLGHKPDKELGQKELDGKQVTEFAAKLGGLEFTMWVDNATRDPVRVEYDSPTDGKILHVVMTDFRFGEKLDESLFSFEVPEGYKVQHLQSPPTVPGGEASVVEALLGYTKRSGGKFPSNLTGWSNWAGAFTKDNHDADASREAARAMANFGAIAPFLVSIPNEDYAYLGAGKTVDEKDAIVFWYKAPDGAYRAIRGDLSVKGVSDQEAAQLVRTRPADEPKADDPSPTQIIDRMVKAYADCKTYRDSGVVTTLFVQAAGNRTTERPFATAFSRPDRLRFEYRDRNSGNRENRYIIWSKGKDIQTWWDVRPGIEKPESLGMAVGAANGVSGGAALTIPALLHLPEVSGGKLTSIADPTRAEDGTLGVMECFRVEGTNGEHPITVWIDKKSYLVLRIDEQQTFPDFRTEETTTYDPAFDEPIADDLLDFDPPVQK